LLFLTFGLVFVVALLSCGKPLLRCSADSAIISFSVSENNVVIEGFLRLGFLVGPPDSDGIYLADMLFVPVDC